MTPRLLWISWFCWLLVGCAPIAPRALTAVTQYQGEAWTHPLSSTPLRQTFILPHDSSVNEIEVVLAVPEDAPTLDTRPLSWSVSGSDSTLARSGVIETAGYPSNTPLRIVFDPIAPGASIELALSAPAAADISLWRSATDSYPQGTLLENPRAADGDLLFVLRAQETPLTLGPALAAEAREWERAAQWLPLALIAPGWLLLWLLGNGEGRPRAAAAAGLSLALIPIAYLWSALIDLHVYLPLARSLLNVAAALTLFVVVRRWRWLWRAWREAPIGAVTLLALAIFLSIATWLLAARAYLAPPGTEMLESGLLAERISDNGVVPLPAPPLPPAALAAFLSTVSQEAVGTLLMFTGLVLAVAAVPALFALGEEITERGALAVWLLPLAWLWPGLWAAVASGDWFALYSYAVMPVAVALGLRAMRAEGARRRALLLAALPLAALFLVQGLWALLAWALSVATAFVLSYGRAGTDSGVSRSLPHLLTRGVAWLFLSVTLLAPTLAQRMPVIAPPTHSLGEMGYGYLALALGLALLLWGGRERLKGLTYPGYAVIAALLLALSWWRSAPLPPSGLALQPDEQAVLTWMGGRNTPVDSQSLINLEAEAEGFAPRDGMFWSPLFNGRPTALTMAFEEPALLRRALAPGALADAPLRDDLRRAGITHVLLGASDSPLRAADLRNREWARIAYQSGGAYLFELLAPGAQAQ